MGNFDGPGAKHFPKIQYGDKYLAYANRFVHAGVLFKMPRLRWLKWVFVGNGRLRSGWRVVSYVIVSRLALFLALLALVLALALKFAAQGIAPGEIGERVAQATNDLFGSTVGLGVAEIIQVVITLSTVLVWRRALDKKPFRSLGLDTRGAGREFLIGVGIAGAEWCVIFAFSLATSVITIRETRFDGTHLLFGVGLLTLFNLLVGLNEELDARGYILQNLSEGIRFIPAVLVSSLYFGALHLLNPGAGPAAVLGVVLFGITASLTYWATGRLWMPIGLHAASNILEGPVFGFLVSGLDMGGLFQLRVNGPEWLMGGTFGPEAGALTIVPEIILIGLLFLWGRSVRMKAAPTDRLSLDGTDRHRGDVPLRTTHSQ